MILPHTMQSAANRLAHFGSFQLDLSQRVLLKDGKYIPFPARVIPLHASFENFVGKRLGIVHPGCTIKALALP
jgi:hypothetical protein